MSSRLDPATREEAFAYQFQDDVKIIQAASKFGEDEFEKAVSRLEMHIKAYRSKPLRKQVAKARNKYDASREFMEKNFPDLICHKP